MLNLVPNFLYQSYFINILIFGTSLLILYLVSTDDRFTFSRKILFLGLISFLYILSFYLKKAPFQIIEELFWFSFVLNGSFIFHALILDRIFHYFWKNHKSNKKYEYYGFIVSRISFTMSLSGLNYSAMLFRDYFQYFFNDFSIRMCYETNKTNKFYKNYNNLYETYIKANIILYYLFKFLFYVIDYASNLIRVICINFSIIFVNYSLLLMGQQKKEWNIQIILTFILQFSVILLISILIGYPRLYIIWSIQILVESYKIWNLKYTKGSNYKKIDFNKLNFWGKIQETLKNYHETSYLYDYHECKYEELDQIYEKPYHPFFMFELCKFNFYSDTQTKYDKFWGIGHAWNENFPIDELFKYHPWTNIAKGYIWLANESYIEDRDDDDDHRDPIIRIAEAIYWARLINKDDSFIIELISDLDYTDPDILIAAKLKLIQFYDNEIRTSVGD